MITPKESNTGSQCHSKLALMRILAVCHQGSRSIDAVLHASQSNWTELRKYYHVDGRQEMIKESLADLGFQFAVPAGDAGSRPFQVLPWSIFFTSWLKYLGNKWRTQWHLSETEHAVFGSALGRLWNFLECDKQPPLEALIALRLDLTTAASYLDRLLCGIPELGMIQAVEYYAPPPGKKLQPIGEVLQHVISSTPFSRQIAKRA